MKYKHIIWDYDGTLVDSYPAMAAAFSAVLAERGITEPPSEIMSHMKVSMGHAIQHYAVLCGLDDAFFGRFKTLRENAEAENAKPFGGAAELCRAICENGGENYLFTHRGESALRFLEKFGLSPYFTELITAERGFARKPSPDAIFYLMNKYTFPPGEALMVGDRDLDMLSAKNAGIQTCFFAGGNEPSCVAEFNINHFSELYPILGM